MNKLLGSVRSDTCSGCRGGAHAKSEGGNKPLKRNQRVIQVRESTFVMLCDKCGTRNIRKLNRADIAVKK